MSQIQRKSVKGIADRAIRADLKARTQTKDSFQNFMAGLGIGTNNQMSASTYGFNPITRVRTILEWIHRGSWLGGIAIDVVADDCTRAGVELTGELEPSQIDDIEELITELNIWPQINDCIKWSRLYGGCVGLMMVDGQDPASPLRIETISKKQFRGVLPLDRWMVEPSLNELVQEQGPNIGLPKYYMVVADAPATPQMKIHYTRCLRLEGVRLPYWQRLTENLWGLSVLERLYDRMVAFDSATTGAAQLVYKSYIRTYKIDGLRQNIAAGGDALAATQKYVEMMRFFQGIEGVTLLDAKDEFEAHSHNAFAGISDCLLQFGQQLSGALQIPLVRLFGQSPAGLNATGESDLRMYYDGINQYQNANLKMFVANVYRMVAQSLGIKVPQGFGLKFRPLWQLTEGEKAEVGERDAVSVATAYESGIISLPTALKELKQSSKVSGRFSNVSDEEIKQAEAAPPPGAAEALMLESQEQGLVQSGEQHERAMSEPVQQAKNKAKVSTRDMGLLQVGIFPLVIEHDAGSYRYDRRLPAAYGYIRQTDSAESGDQMDCFVGPAKNSSKIFIVDSFYQDGTFDEHKVMFNFVDETAAAKAFRTYYFDRRCFIADVQDITLNTWLRVGDMKQPYTQTVDTQFTVAAHELDEVCNRCKYYQSTFCVNQKVARDPRVPEWDGMKVVTPASWCKEFQLKGENK